MPDGRIAPVRCECVILVRKKALFRQQKKPLAKEGGCYLAKQITLTLVAEHVAKLRLGIGVGQNLRSTEVNADPVFWIRPLSHITKIGTNFEG